MTTSDARVVGAVARPGDLEGQGTSCPTCGRSNEVTRRFCGKCGTALHAAAPVAVPVAHAPWWRRRWRQLTNAERRAARRAYRRSLPPMYRWRRTVLSVLTVFLVGLVLSVAGRNPAGLVRAAWHDLRRDVVQVEDVQAIAVPPTSVVSGTSAAAAVDGADDTPWSTKWTAPKVPPACGESTGMGRLQLTLPATRIRQIRVVSGATDPAQRTLQLLPKTLHITTSDGTCVTTDLTRAATVQTIEIDTNVPVTSVTISVAATHAATDPRAVAVVSLSEVSLWSRPS